MPPRNREELLKEAYSRLDIPQFVYIYESADGQVIGPYEPDFFWNYKERREAKEAKAIEALTDMSDLELLHLIDDDGDLDGFALENGLIDPPPWYAAGFAVRSLTDFSYWCKLNYWTLQEATCLSIGFSPEHLPDPPRLLPYDPPQPPLEFYWKRHERLRRAMDEFGTGDDCIGPKAFAKWALKVELEIPRGLLDCLGDDPQSASPAMLNKVDARRLESTQKIILALIANFFGEHQREIGEDALSEAAKSVSAGLARLGLTMDRKTVKSTLSGAAHELKRFQSDQSKKDETGD